MTKLIKKIGERGELVIPKSLRKSAGISPKTKVRILAIDAGILIIPLKNRARDFAGYISKGKKISHEELEAAYFDYMASM